MNTLKDLAITYLLGGQKEEPLAGSTLREAAEGLGVHIGAAIGVPHMHDKEYTALAAAEYDLVTAENACKMNTIARSESEFKFDQCDSILEFAEAHQMMFRGHNTCWANTGQPYYQPDFIKNETDPAKIEAFLKNYITTTIKKYADKAIAWDVINEAIDDGNNHQIRSSVWAKVDDFICKAVTWAHEADPKAELFYNDYSHASMTGYQKGKSDAVFNLVQDLKKRNCPIHGIGFQLHVNVDYADQVKGVIDNMKRYEDLGIKVHFTEIDVKCHLDNGKCKSWDEGELKKQAGVYESLLKACLGAKNCESFETWGITDKYSWLPAPQYGLPFDKDMKKKSAYDVMLKILQSWPRDDPAVLARNSVKKDIVEQFLI